MIDKEQAKNSARQVVKIILKKSMKPLLIGGGIFLVAVIIFSAVTWFLKKLDTKENPDDPKNAPAAVRNFMNDTTIDENGNIISGKSIQELWNELKQRGNRVTAYLNSAEELGKLIYAARALDYPDTRGENVIDEPIKWNELDINSKEIQGVVKFKRALADGKKITMTYVSPTEFQELMNKYKSSGSEKDKKEALKHFTIEKTSSNMSGTVGGKVPSLKGVVFMGDSILSTFNEFKENELKEKEGAILMYKSGSNASYFTGKKTVDNRDFNTIETADGHFDWDANFQKVTNPTGFYLMLGQNALFDPPRKEEMDELDKLVKKIRSHYPTPPIFISSVLHYYYDNGEAKRAATSMNEELKEYCNRNDNVYYSDILRGYNDNLEELTKDDKDHPNAKGVEVLLNNVKENIISASSSLEEILRYACSWVGKVPYKSSVTDNDPNGERWMDLAEDRGSDCSHFIHKVFGHFGVLDNSDDGFISSQFWGNGGDDEGAPGTVKIGTDLSKASPGDVIWQDYGDGWHVQIYLGNHKVVECTSDNNYEGVRITKISDNHKIDQMVHFTQFPTDPTAYFEPETGILHSSNTSYNTNNTVNTTNRTTSTNNNTTTNTKVAPIDDFSEETRNIIMSHINDFNQHNYKDFIEKYPGGYDGYMQSLGGVFAKYGGKGKKIEVNNAGDLQEAAEFVWGLMSIWGFDYWNDSTYWSWGQDEEFEGLYDSAYYTSHSFSGGGYSQANINDICSNPNKDMRTNCNAGIDTFLWTTTLENNGSEGYATKELRGKKIERKEDLQVGDLVHFYHNSDETDWGHVAIVGEIDSNTGDVIMYDSGNRFIRTGKYKFPLSLESGGAYENYEKWVGRRHYDLDQSTNRSVSNSNNQNAEYKVKVATWSEHQDKVVSDDPRVVEYDTKVIPNMTATSIPYQAIVSKYKMPFNYLWTMLVYSQDKNYTFDLADLVKNSKIEITIHDNLNDTTNIITDTYTDYTKINAEADVNISFENVSTVKDRVKNPKTGKEDIIDKEIISNGSTTKHGKGDGHNSIDYKVVQTTRTKTNTLDIALTLADAWCAIYEKKYDYNEPVTTKNNDSVTLDDIPDDPYTRKGELGCEEAKNEIDEDAIEQATYYDRRNLEITGYENKVATYQTTRIKRIKNTYTEITTSSYTSTGGTNIDRTTVSTVSTPKTGSLNLNNYVPLIEPSTHRDGDNPLQGFCLVGDDMVAYVIHHYSSGTCTLYLADINTMQEYDHMDGFKGHGNTIAYDSVTGDIIFPETSVMELVAVNKTTKKLENKRTVSLPQWTNSPSQVAYNATHDLFIANSHVYSRQAFYSGGKPTKDLDYKMLNKNHLYAGCTSYGNHVYYYFAEGSRKSKNYFIVCDLNTGKQVEIIRDNMQREAEEASFSSDGTLYTAYAESGPPFHRTDYNYFSDNNIEKSNVSQNGSSATNEIARYNTGGEHKENSYFQKVFNSHYNARSNILSIKEWLYEALEQNEDTVNMIDITKYLIARAQGAEENKEEFLAALEKLSVYDMTQVGTETGGLLSITSTTFTREQFIQLVQSYSAALNNGLKTKTFRDNAGVIYDVCKKNNINPVLCAAQAWQEQNWAAPSTSPYNYWGIAVYNGQNYGSSYTSMEAAVENYCKNINQRLKGENEAAKWSKICAQYNNKFTGGINNLYDVLSNWACVKNADSNHPGQAKHASEYVDSVVKCATQIFGEGALTASGGGGDFLAVAQNIWKKICNGNYSYGGSSIPCTGSTVDCSSYVSWVLYEYGYTDFKGGQHCTQQFKNTNWNQKYGWTEKNVKEGQNPYDSIQPGDLFVRDPGNNNGHITLVVRKENGKIYCYDCGNSKNWRNNPNAEALDKSYMLTDSRSGKIIRVTPKQ